MENAAPLSPPSCWVRRFVPALPAAGRLLDVACGKGRHARFLADAGFAVTAIDRNIEAVQGIAGIRAIEADLEDGSAWPLAGQSFDGVVVTNYLNRPLMARLFASVDPAGMLIYETFMDGNEKFGRPGRPEFLLRAGELLGFVPAGFSVIAFEQGRVMRGPGAAMVQRIAVRHGGPEVSIPNDRAEPTF